MTACPSCQADPCLADQPDLPGPERCVLGHAVQPCRPRRSADGLRVCRGHAKGTRQRLEELAPLHAALGTVAAAAAGGMRSGGRSAESRLPVHDRAAALRGHIRQKLVSWVVMVGEERGLTVPSLAAWRPARPVWYPDMAQYADVLSAARHRRVAPARLTPVGWTAPDPGELAGVTAWLGVHHAWLLAQDYVDDYATDLAELHSAARSIVYPSGSRRMPTGAPCPAGGCPGSLWAFERPTEYDPLPEAVCDTCDLAVPKRQWADLAGRNPWLTAVQLAELWDVPLPTVQEWARTRHWPCDGGRPACYSYEAAKASLRQYRPRPRTGAST